MMLADENMSTAKLVTTDVVDPFVLSSEIAALSMSRRSAVLAGIKSAKSKPTVAAAPAAAGVAA